MTLELPASPRPESPSRAPPEKPAQAALHRREKPRSARTSRGRRRPTCAARQRVRNPDGCAPTRPCAGRIAVGVLLGQVGQLRLGLPLLKCDAVLANREKVRGVMNRSDFTGGAIDQTELQLARLRIELQNTFVVFESDSCSELDAVALRGDFARHLPACHVGNDIASRDATLRTGAWTRASWTSLRPAGGVPRWSNRLTSCALLSITSSQKMPTKDV